MQTKLKDWCTENHVSYNGARKMIKEGRFPHPIKQVSPRIRLVIEPDSQTPKYIGYARVSGSKQKFSLDKQAQRINHWAKENKLELTTIIAEVGSGLNDNRPKWNKILSDKTITHIIIEHRDRATRFGFQQITSALHAQGRNIIIIDPTEVTDDLVRDMTEILTSMCARLYGKRGAQQRACRALKATKNE
jgi:putative resolvase